jgi:GntR family transcriptional repressor for pyruvate dehydrogenase complex
MHVIQTLEPTTLSSQVARHLLELISRERLKPGDAVPSEMQLSRDLQVSRGSVREAYRTLAALGILEIGNGRRPRLQPMSAYVLSQVFGYALTTAQVSANHLVQLRRAIEVHTAQQAATYISGAQKVRLRGLVDEMRACIARDDQRRRLQADLDFHMVLAESSGNPLCSLLLTSLRAPIELLMTVDLGKRRSNAELVRIVDAHDLIAERVCAGDPLGAGTAMACHFDLSVASLPVSDEELFADVLINANGQPA